MSQEDSQFETSLKVLASAGGRRNLLGSLGAAGLALLAAVGLGEATAQNGNKGDGKKNGNGPKKNG